MIFGAQFIQSPANLLPRRRRRAVACATETEIFESRILLAAGTQLPLVSGQTTTFTDADGSRVSLRLRGPGSGTVTIHEGMMESLELHDTTSRSSLTIVSRGGRVAGTTIQSVTIHGAAGQTQVFGTFKGTALSLNANGQFHADGGVGKIHVQNLEAGSQVHIDGSLNHFYARDVLAQIDVAATLERFTARNLGPGAAVHGGTLKTVRVTQLVDDATIQAGDGGWSRGFFKNVENSHLASHSVIGGMHIRGEFIGSTLTVNMIAGTDGNFSSLDDQVYNTSFAGSIDTLHLKGPLSSDSRIVTSGKIHKTSGKGMKLAEEQNAWQFAASTFIPLSVVLDEGANLGSGADGIWIAVFGQEIATPGPGQVPPVGTTYYLVASEISSGNPIAQSTAGLYPGPSTPDQAILPSSTLAAWGNHLSLPVPPPGNQYTGRILISVGAPIQAQVSPSNGTVASPNPANGTDPSNGTIYDFLEFTVTNFSGVPNLDIDTSQVDAFGLPMQLQFFEDSAGTKPFNTTFTGSTTKGSNVITGITNTTNLGQGDFITGPGIPPGATIQTLVGASKNSPGSVTINQYATATQTGASFVSHAGGPVGVQAARNDILATTGKDSYLSFINSKITSTNQAARPFLESYAALPTFAATQRSGPILSASNAGPIVVNSPNHGLTTGDVVTIRGELGNTAANGTFQVTVVDLNNFSLNGSHGNGADNGGGTWQQGTITGATASGEIVITTLSTAGLENGDLIKIEGILGNPGANGLFTITDVTSTTFKLVNSQGTGTYTMGGIWSLYDSTPPRLVSPKDVVEQFLNASNPDALNNYFNETIDAFFLKYFTGTIGKHTGGGETFTLISDASTSAVVYSGQTVAVGNNYVLRLNATTGTAAEKAVNYDIYYPFFETNLPDPSIYEPIFYVTGATAPSWIISAGQQYESASQMIFACDAVFADNNSRGFTGTASLVLGDLEDSISAAFNRGLALYNSSSWGDPRNWFLNTDVNNGIYNYWVEYWHQTGLTSGDLAYAFPYDDKFGASTNLNQNNVGLAKITLGTWTSTAQASSITAFKDFPVIAQQGGQVTLTAQVTSTGTPSGTVTFYINGVPVNSVNSTATPPLQPVSINNEGIATLTATLPALPDGSITHTYTVSAVYSGDGTHLPSVSTRSLQLVGSNGDFPIAVSPSSGSAGATVTITGTLPGTNPAGTVELIFARSDGSEPQSLKTLTVSGNNLNTQVTLPDTVIHITGTIAAGTLTQVDGVTNLVDIIPGQAIAASNIPAGTTVAGSVPGQLTLSHAATQSGIVMLRIGNQTFQATLTEGSNVLTGVLNVDWQATGDIIHGPGIPEHTTIQGITPGSLTLSAAGTAGAVSATVSGVNQVFQIQAFYQPTSGSALTGLTQYQITS
ncbi:beta-1,3-glucanase family protein [Planctomicrobium sp. SH664]|uniref:beta-1,3-glucanase family protein n=1 Tax=Planctomicrobium sp. SH664 TaxID=3448125 RepID=UPI003F5BF6D0